MLQRILECDKELFLYLNSKHSAFLDPIMLFLSSYTDWIIACMLMIALIYFKGETYRKTAILFFSLTLGGCVFLTSVIKEMVRRPRPIHNTAWENIIHAIEDFDSSYSFFSSHSATTFCMAVFFFLFFRKRDNLYGSIALFWAASVAYSRIYVAKHYPFDVFCGTLFGIIMGILGYKLFEYYKKRKEFKAPTTS